MTLVPLFGISTETFFDYCKLDSYESIDDLISKYYPISGKIATVGNFANFDIEWIKPDEVIGLGNDLIEGLDNCFGCVKKHIGRAKAFYEEFKLGYPNHEPLMFNEFVRSNKALEEAFMYYSDSLAQLDMASCELVGDMSDLQEGYQVKIIELANEILKLESYLSAIEEIIPRRSYKGSKLG